MKFWKSFLVLMAVSIVTLNTGGCSTPTKNASIRVYVDHVLHNPDIVLLQESNTLTHEDLCWKEWPFKAFCTPGSTKGSGVTTLIKKNPDLEIKESETIFTGHAYYVRVEIRSNIFHVYNVLIPQDDTIAFKTLCAIEKHCSQHRNGVIVYGGDFNCTLDPSLDRFHQPKERRHKIASALKTCTILSLCVMSGVDATPTRLSSPGLEGDPMAPN